MCSSVEKATSHSSD